MKKWPGRCLNVGMAGPAPGKRSARAWLHARDAGGRDTPEPPGMTRRARSAGAAWPAPRGPATSARGAERGRGREAGAGGGAGWGGLGGTGCGVGSRPGCGTGSGNGPRWVELVVKPRRSACGKHWYRARRKGREAAVELAVKPSGRWGAADPVRGRRGWPDRGRFFFSRRPRTNADDHAKAQADRCLFSQP